jgi:hypothetical protein
LKNVLRARVSSFRLLCLFCRVVAALQWLRPLPKGRSRSPTPPAQGNSALSEFLPLRSLRWPRFLPRLRLPGSLLCLPAAAGFPWQFWCTDPRATLPPTLVLAVLTAERRWLRPLDPLRFCGSDRRTSYSQTSVRRNLDAKSCGPAISGSFKTTESCRIHLKNVLLSRTSLLGSPEPACSPAGLMV